MSLLDENLETLCCFVVLAAVSEGNKWKTCLCRKETNNDEINSGSATNQFRWLQSPLGMLTHAGKIKT